MTTLHADVLPKEGENGWFGGRETYLAPCECGNPNCLRPTSYYVGGREWCVEQTAELRGEDNGLSEFDKALLDVLSTDDPDLQAMMQRLPGLAPKRGGWFGGLAGIGDMLGGLLGGGNRRQPRLRVGGPLLVEQRPGETEEDAISRALGEMMGGQSSDGRQSNADDPFAFLRRPASTNGFGPDDDPLSWLAGDRPNYGNPDREWDEEPGNKPDSESTDED